MGWRNTMVTSDFRPEVKRWPFRACAIKLCNIMLINWQMAEILASRCILILTTRLIVTFRCGLGYGQIPRSTERTVFVVCNSGNIRCCQLVSVTDVLGHNSHAFLFPFVMQCGHCMLLQQLDYFSHCHRRNMSTELTMRTCLFSLSTAALHTAPSTPLHKGLV